MDIELRIKWDKSTVVMLVIGDTIQNDPPWILPKSYSEFYTPIFPLVMHKAWKKSCPIIQHKNIFLLRK